MSGVMKMTVRAVLVVADTREVVPCSLVETKASALILAD